MKIEIETVTPDQANAWLATNTDNNRRLSKTTRPIYGGYATKHQAMHHTIHTSPSPNPYNPETIADLEAAIERTIQRGQALANQLYYTHRQRLGGRPTGKPAWAIRADLESLHDQLELLLADLDRRRI